MKKLDYCLLPTTLGKFRMYDTGDEHIRLISFGDIYQQGENPLVRIHSSCMASEIFGATDCDCADQLHESMKLMATERSGIIIHLHQEGRGQGLSNKIKAVFNMQNKNVDTVEAFEELGLEQDVRNYESAIKLLKNIGVKKVRLISNNHRKSEALLDARISVETINTHPVLRPENTDYLYSKNEKMGHSLPLKEIKSDNGKILFYHSDQVWGYLSNFSTHAIFISGIIWPTVEHFYQAQKFKGEAIEMKILTAGTPILAKNIATDNASEINREDWGNIKETVMLSGLRAKFTQHPHLNKMLFETKNRKLVEHTSNDIYWGDGGDGCGKNRLGKLLEKLREELRSDNEGSK